MTVTLRDYQLKDLNELLKHDRFGLWHQQSCGKSFVFCMAIKIRYEVYGDKSIIICPTGLHCKTKEDVLQCTDWDSEQVAIVGGTPLKRQAIYKDDNVRCFIISADTYTKEWEMILNYQPQVNHVVIDEMTAMYKSHSSKRTQSLYKSSMKIKKFVFSTGTIVAGRYDSAYPAIALCEPRFYMSYQNFMNCHAVYGNFNNVVGWKNPVRLAEILKRIGIRRTVNDCYPDYKEDIIMFEKCDMDANHKKAYKELETEAMLELEDEWLDAGNPMTKSIKCRRLVSAPESFNLISKVEMNGKDEVLKVHFQNAIDSNEQLVVFSTFVDEQNRIANLAAEMGLSVGLINGSTPTTKRGEIDKGFRDGKIQIIVASPACCAFGFNWQNAAACIFASLDYDDSTFDQARKRINRGSRPTPAKIYILTYGTKIENRIFQILSRKRKEFTAVQK